MSVNVTPKAASLQNHWATTPLRFLLISLFWLPISLFWGMMLGQVLPIRAEQFAGSAKSGTFLAIISIAGAACGLLVQFLVGPISDRCASRFGRRRPFIVTGTLLAVIAMLAFAYTGSFAGLVLAFVGIQFFLNLANGPYQALIPDLVPLDRQGVASGYMGVMSLVGDAGGPLLAGLILSHAHTLPQQEHGVQSIIWIVAGLLVPSMVIMTTLVPDAPAQPLPPGAVAESLASRYRLNIRENPDFYWLLISRTVCNLGFYTVITFLLYYVKYALHSGDNAVRDVTRLQELAIGGALLGTVPAGMLADRISKKKVIYASTAFSVVAGAVFALTSSTTVAEYMALLFGAGLGMFRAVDWAFACNLLPGGSAAKYMSIWSLSTMVPQLAAPLFGPIADRLNHNFSETYGAGIGYRGAMVLTLVYMIAGVIFVARVREKVV